MGKTAMQLWLAELLDLHRSEKMVNFFNDVPSAAGSESHEFPEAVPLNCPFCEKIVTNPAGTFDTGQACGDIWTCNHCDREFTWKDLQGRF